MTSEAETAAPALRLTFERGTLVLSGPAERVSDIARRLEDVVHDPRIGTVRAPAFAYRAALTALVRSGWPFSDEAKGYRELALVPRTSRTPYPHQLEAVTAWAAQRHMGTVVLPTGSGKTFVAELAILKVQRSTLVVAPTLDLMSQWYDRLTVAFGEPVGAVGGGSHEVRDLTVTTYDSFYRYADHFGHRFGLVVFDEVHHLPGPSYALGAELMIAPYRLGLTATPERSDGRDAILARLVGGIVYRCDVKDLAGSHLAPYETVRVTVDLTADERARYEAARATYLSFAAARGVRMGTPQGFQRFLRECMASAEGRRAHTAYREQRALMLDPEAKRRVLGSLLRQHRDDRVIIFTNDNRTAYAIATAHLLPVITHQTGVKERQFILSAFHAGDVRAVVTSRVLNEGVDVPAARIAIVVSGTGTVREHVQRLGRILRRAEGKEALLYEIVTANTAEVGLSARRRDHAAYRDGE